MLLKTTLIKPCLLKQKSYHHYADYQSIVRAYEDRSTQFGMWYLLRLSQCYSYPHFTGKETMLQSGSQKEKEEEKTKKVKKKKKEKRQKSGGTDSMQVLLKFQ